jgi:hypothetical protein
MRIVTLVLFLLAIACFLLPWAGFTNNGFLNMSASGMDMVRNIYHGGNMTGSESYFFGNRSFVFATLAAAVIGVVFCLFKSKWALIIRILMSIAGVALLVFMYFEIKHLFVEHFSGMNYNFLRLKFLTGYYLTGAVFLAAAVVSSISNRFQITRRGIED